MFTESDILLLGIFGIMKQLLHLSVRVKKQGEERDEENLRQSPTQTLLCCFMLGWFIIGKLYSLCSVIYKYVIFILRILDVCLGSIWVYKEFEPNYDPTHGKYCNKTLYMFAFWLITSVYVTIGIITMCLCSISIACLAFQRDSI